MTSARRPGPQLAAAPALLAGVVARQRAEGLPARLPLVISEYGYSAFAGRAEADLPGALLDAGIAGQFLSLGGSAAYLYGYEPDALMREVDRCNTWGNLTLLQSDDAHRIVRPLATYWTARMVTGLWAGNGRGRDRVYRVSTGDARVQAYALRRPDGRLAVLMVNSAPDRSVRLAPDVAGRPLRLPADLWVLSRARYRWHPRGPRGYARPDLPPAHTRLAGRDADRLTLPPWSVAVLRTRGAP